MQLADPEWAPQPYPSATWRVGAAAAREGEIAPLKLLSLDVQMATRDGADRYVRFRRTTGPQKWLRRASSHLSYRSYSHASLSSPAPSRRGRYRGQGHRLSACLFPLQGAAAEHRPNRGGRLRSSQLSGDPGRSCEWRCVRRGGRRGRRRGDHQRSPGSAGVREREWRRPRAQPSRRYRQGMPPSQSSQPEPCLHTAGGGCSRVHGSALCGDIGTAAPMYFSILTYVPGLRVIRSKCTSLATTRACCFTCRSCSRSHRRGEDN